MGIVDIVCFVLKFQLHGLPANYDLSICDKDGKEIASSGRAKKKSEKVILRGCYEL